MVPQHAQTQGFDDMVADTKKALGEGALKIQWWRMRKFCHTGSKTTFAECEGASIFKKLFP
jgi:hypothetical protein